MELRIRTPYEIKKNIPPPLPKFRDPTILYSAILNRVKRFNSTFYKCLLPPNKIFPTLIIPQESYALTRNVLHFPTKIAPQVLFPKRIAKKVRKYFDSRAVLVIQNLCATKLYPPMGTLHFCFRTPTR